MQINRLAFRLTMVALCLTFIVIMLGAYTRLKDAGLGCPDWPGCYGQLIAPASIDQILKAAQSFPGQAIEPHKALIEMLHRYFAGILGLLILAITFLIFWQRKFVKPQISLAILLISVLAFQVLLGRWTVTLKLLPIVVMLHLIGGLSLLALLGLMMIRFSPLSGHHPEPAIFKWAAILGLGVVILQIMLGGWTTANYAGLSCPDFPHCQGKIWPEMNLPSAFQLWLPGEQNFQGGILDNTARVTIHMMHRLGALLTFLYIFGLSFWLLMAAKTKLIQRIAWSLILLLTLQIFLGIINVLWLLPVPVAVAHNGVAALLLLSMVILNDVLISAKNHDL